MRLVPHRALRRIRHCLSTWVANRKARNAQAVAATALEAAQAQHTVIPGERTAAAMFRALAPAAMALDERIARTDTLIEARFRKQAHAAPITSMPGMGSLLGAEFIACTGGNLDAIGSSGRLVGIAGLAPVSKDSGRISGDMRRPHRYHRRLLRVLYLSAQGAARCCPTSKAFYERKRSEDKSHEQAALAGATSTWSRSGITQSPSATAVLGKPDWESSPPAASTSPHHRPANCGTNTSAPCPPASTGAHVSA